MFKKPKLKFLLVLVLLLGTGCKRNEYHHGYSFEDKDLNALETGKTSEKELLDYMGSPTSTADFGPKTYYYISIQQFQKAFWHPQVFEQNVMEVVFDSGDVVKEIKLYKLADGNKVNYDFTTTKLKGNKETYIQHIFHNLGRFNATLPKM
ncbi:outer membrane protein assembly factor BamE [Rickettsiales endosymbiont of Peranema trichophorum]|uniref:outer membrane protein assembly factor BamE n=1 Tax=Rickettsiales endosymbiont of Peranema trichophorum TaxID=2486577 RepID=UPI0010233C49|nr:outer membrane protein assembly factor BamE [Rickettsiales endosymbiont of Peranema trichophorum]RZI45241.1 outer membrane protein assembly factor BamE [Rickettsiales endosymbiont of Peranema trichophorum]